MKDRANDHSKYQSWIDPNECVPYEKNTKEHTEKQIRNIANSIKRFGWQQDAVITSDNVLVIGHGRRLAALELGCMMPYHRIDKNADELTDEDIRELRIADNQTNAETGYDFQLLQDDIEDLTFDGFEFDFGIEETSIGTSEEQKGSMKDKYLVPPFSVIYTNKPDWLARKRAWVEKGLHSEIGRGDKLAYNSKKNIEDNFAANGMIKQTKTKDMALKNNTISRMLQMKGKHHGNAV